MTLNKSIILGFFTSLALLLSFQNCSPTHFKSDSESIQKSGVDAGIGDSITTLPEDSEIDPRQIDPQEVKCDATLVKAAIAYDSLPVTNAAPVSFTHKLPEVINAENISFVGKGAASNVSIVGRNVEKVGSMAIHRLQINAQKIGEVGSMAAGMIHLVAHSVADPSSFAGNLCIAAHSVPAIGSAAGSITVFGREENGVRAQLKTVAHVSGYLSLYDLDVDQIQSLATKAKLDNVHLKSLRRGAGELTLVNSQIDVIDTFTGTIRLRGNSSIGTITQQANVRVVRE